MENKKQRVYNKVLLKIKSAPKIVLIIHKNPDGDTIGSGTAFLESINLSFPEKKVEIVCVDKIPNKLTFIPNSLKTKDSLELNKGSLYIFLDIASPVQTWYEEIHRELFEDKNYNTINIDHHITNKVYAKQNIVLTNYASTTMIVFDLLKSTWLSINKYVATSLLAWLMTDTGWFKHSNTDKKTFEYASELLELWWDLGKIVNRFFKSNNIKTIKLWWKIISSSFIDNNNVLYTYINKSDLDSFWVNYEDISWVIDYLNMVEWIKYSAMLTQKWDYVKWSLRTLRDDIDLTEIASKYGWWWHKKASWFSFEWVINEVKNLKF